MFKNLVMETSAERQKEFLEQTTESEHETADLLEVEEPSIEEAAEELTSENPARVEDEKPAVKHLYSKIYQGNDPEEVMHSFGYQWGVEFHDKGFLNKIKPGPIYRRVVRGMIDEEEGGESLIRKDLARLGQASSAIIRDPTKASEYLEGMLNHLSAKKGNPYNPKETKIKGVSEDEMVEAACNGYKMAFNEYKAAGDVSDSNTATEAHSKSAASD